MSKKFYTGRLACESEFVLKLEVLGSDFSVLSGLCAKNRSQLFKSCLRLKPINRQILKLGNPDFSIITSKKAYIKIHTNYSAYQRTTGPDLT